MWLILLGVIAIAKIINGIFRALERGFTNHVKSILVGNDLRATYGEWAVVTGATSGIGKALVEEFASKGLNIILISRSEKKLQDVASNLEKEYGVKTKYFVMDFRSRKSCAEIVEELKKLDVGILVNNVGMNVDMVAPFVDVCQSTVQDIINVNCGPAMELTALLMPYLKARSQPSLIIMNSSTSAVVPCVYISIYSATKVFLDVWSKCLTKECVGTQVKVKVLRPLLVNTAMTDNCDYARNNIIVVTAKSYAKSACRTLFTDLASSGMPFSDTYMYFFTSLPKNLALLSAAASFEIVRKQQNMEKKVS